MDPATMMALASAAGAAGGGKSGKTSTTTSQQQSTNVASPVAQNMNLAFNPLLSLLTGGGGFSPSTGGGLSGGLNQTPSNYANPSAAQSLTEGAGSVLPRMSPSGYGVGPGFGMYQTPYQTAPRGMLGNDTFLLFVIAGAVFWFASQEGS
jgi:hypothetical protein